MMIPVVEVKKIVEELVEYIYIDSTLPVKEEQPEDPEDPSEPGTGIPDIDDIEDPTIDTEGPVEPEITRSEKDRFLYKMFNGITDGNFDFYKQALSMYSRGQDNPNNIKISLEYPKDKTGLPCYVIREPGKVNGPDNSIGKISGMSPFGGFNYRDSRSSNFEIMCVGVNMLQSIIMSETLYALLLASYDMLAQRYVLIDFSVRELMAETNLIPTPLFVKSISLNVSMDNAAPSLVNPTLLGKVLFEDAGLEATLLSNGEVMDGLPGVRSRIIK